MAFALCMVAVVLMAEMFLPGQSLWETLTTDAVGRSLPVRFVVLVAGVVAEGLKTIIRFVRQIL
jgi:hypothetical protein